MNAFDLDALDKLIRKALKLQSLIAELRPFLELVRQLDGKDFATLPTDRLTRIHEAAQVFGRRHGDNRRIRQGGFAHAALRQFRPTPFLVKRSHEVAALEAVAFGG